VRNTLLIRKEESLSKESVADSLHAISVFEGIIPQRAVGWMFEWRACGQKSPNGGEFRESFCNRLSGIRCGSYLSIREL
jgi:hypothetical protein